MTSSGDRGGRAVATPEVGESLTRLLRVTGELARADSVDAVTKIVTYHMADAVGASIAALALLEGDEAHLIGLRGLPASESQRWQRIPLDRPTPATDAIRTGERLVLVGDALRTSYPDLPDRGERVVVVLPLRATGRVAGSISLSFPGGIPPGGTELDFLDIVADLCAQALERIEATATARKQTFRLSFLAEASIELAMSLDLDVALAKVTRMAVPAFADWCAVHVVRDERLHLLAAAHVEPAKAELARTFSERWPPDPHGSTGPWQVARTGRSQLVREVTDEMLVAAARDEEHLRAARELGLRSAVMVPLLVRGRVTGVLSWVSTDAGRGYDEDDLAFAEHLARRAAAAIDNAELYGQTRAAAEQLQRAVLPAAVTGDDTWEVACRYHPSGRTEVGGDFYDGFLLDDGRYVAFLGDVMGRGVAAAAGMAQIRAAARAFASIEPDPGAVLGELDRMVVQGGGDQFVTVVYALADAGAGRVGVANAGHLPPFVVRADGRVERLPYADGPPLGLAPGPRGAVPLDLAPGDTVVAFTDGLVERRDEDIASGLDRLARAVPLLSGRPLEVGLDLLVEALHDESYDDDVAVLALRRRTR